MAISKNGQGLKGVTATPRFTKYEDIRKILNVQAEAALIEGEAHACSDEPDSEQLQGLRRCAIN